MRIRLFRVCWVWLARRCLLWVRWFLVLVLVPVCWIRMVGRLWVLLRLLCRLLRGLLLVVCLCCRIRWLVFLRLRVWCWVLLVLRCWVPVWWIRVWLVLRHLIP
ncbi:Uncharacterised protein [Mycobacterium tuberculosis]|nr:Uncharacterised protein [Mycobacterium tuberculosis]